MIRVLLFGTLSQKAGVREIDIDPGDGGKVVADVVKEVLENYLGGEAGVYMLAVNETQATPETAVGDGDEVAMMPPFSGG